MIAAAEAQRNVIITLQLIADPGNEVAAQEVHKQTIAVEMSVTKAAEEGAKKRGDIEKDISRERDQILNQSISDKQKREKRAGMLAVRDAKKIAKDRKIISQQVAKAIAQDQKQMTSDIKAAKALHVAANRKALESGLAALQGTEDLVEGMRTLGLISEESFEKFMRGFKNVKAGIQVFKGLSEIIWKSREALIALNSATKAQATANALMSASNLRTTATSKLANVATGISGGRRGRSTRGSGGRAAIGAITEGVLGAETIAGGKALLPLIGGIAKLGAIGLVAFEGIQALRRGIYGASESTESLIGAFFDYRKEAAKAEESTKRIGEAEKDRVRRLDDEERFTGRAASRAGHRQEIRSAQALSRRVEFIISGNGSDPINSVENERLEALREVRAAEKEVADVRRTNEDRIKRGQFASSKERLRAAKLLEESGRRLVEADIQRLGVMRDQKKAADDQIKAAEDQKKSLRVRFAELPAYKQARLKNIGERHKSGEELSERDLQFLKDTGFGDNVVSGRRERQAIASGSDSFLANIGDSIEIDKQLEEARKLKKRAEAAPAAAAALRADTAQQEQHTKQRIVEQKDVDDTEASKRAREKAVDDVDPEVGFWEALWNEPTPSVFNLFPSRPAPPRGNPFDPERRQGFVAPQAPDKNNLFTKPAIAQSAGQAADTITQESVAVSQSMKTVLDAVMVGFGEIKDTTDNHQILRRVYS